jgi:amidase
MQPLLGLRCAVLGIGTDFRDSVRVPAAFYGAYGLRTTAQRNPNKGVCVAGAGQESIRAGRHTPLPSVCS